MTRRRSWNLPPSPLLHSLHIDLSSTHCAVTNDQYRIEFVSYHFTDWFSAHYQSIQKGIRSRFGCIPLTRSTVPH